MQASTDQHTSTISFFTPLKLRRRGGHRMVVLPENSDGMDNAVELQPDVDEKLLKALVKATLWERQLRSGKIILKELTQREGVSERYVQHLLRLNFLAPDLKEAILEGRQPEGLNWESMRVFLPLLWNEQKQLSNDISPL